MPQPLLIGASPVGERPLEIRQVLLRVAHGLRVVLRQDVDHPLPRVHRRRPDILGLYRAQPGALDHHRAAHTNCRVLCRDHDIAATEQRGVAGEASP